MDRLSALKKEAAIKEIATAAASLFYQVETEEEFILVMSDRIAEPDVASVIWQSLKKMFEIERVYPSSTTQ